MRLHSCTAALYQQTCALMDLRWNQPTGDAASRALRKGYLHTRLYYCIWHRQLDLHTVETETHSERIFRKCDAVGFLCLISRTQLGEEEGKHSVLQRHTSERDAAMCVCSRRTLSRYSHLEQNRNILMYFPSFKSLYTLTLQA